MTNDDEIDPFARLAAEQISAPVKARMRAAKTREERRIAKQLNDRDVLAQQWVAWHRKRLAKLKAGRYAKAVQDIASFLETMTLDNGSALIELVERGPWRQADADTRYLLLGLIGERIIYLRITEGLAPFDDSIPFSDEPPTVFEIVREILS
jgi:hypothetical protein